MYKKRSKSYKYFFPIEKERDKKQNIKDLDKEYLRKKVQNLTVGQTIKGRVIKILDIGSVIDFDNIQGFLHISEMSDEWIKHPSDVLKMNEIILAKIISKEIDKKGRLNIRLSSKGFKKTTTKQKENKPVRSNRSIASSKPSTEKPFNPPKITNTKRSSSYQYSEEEKKLLDKHIDFYKSLDLGSRVPETEEQKHFVEVCQRQKKPKTVHEKAYIKFKKIAAIGKRLDEQEQIIIKNRLDEQKVKKLRRRLAGQRNNYRKQSVEQRQKAKKTTEKSESIPTPEARRKIKKPVKLKRENEIKRIKKLLIKKNVNFSDNLSLHELKILLKKEINELAKKTDKEMLLEIVRRRKIQPSSKNIKSVYDDDK